MNHRPRFRSTRPARVPMLVLGMALWLAPNAATATVTFFVNDQIGFDAATSGHELLGTEDWSSAGMASAAQLDEPILPGVASTPLPSIFASGVNASTGLTVQSNTLGNQAASLMTGGGLFFAPTNYEGVSGNLQPSNQLSTFTDNSSFDLIFSRVAGKDPVAASMSAVFYQTGGQASSGDISVAVFNPSNVLLGTTTVPNVADVSESSFLGILATNGDKIGRVNLWAGSDAVPGADNIDVYAAPEPAVGALGAVSLLALFALRRRPSSLR